LESAVGNAEAIALMTRWSEFERLPELLAGRESQPLVVDGRRMLAKDSVARYRGIGLS
jgi:UDPglucose 6-dehydrogenase/GDP-mannose 6-dehydrogenase